MTIVFSDVAHFHIFMREPLRSFAWEFTFCISLLSLRSIPWEEAKMHSEVLRLEICSLVFCLKGILDKQFHNICRISFTRSFICCRVLWHPEIYIVYFVFGVFVFHLLAFMIIVVITSVTFIVPFEYLMGTWLWPERAAWHPRILPGWQLACSHTNTGHGRDKVAWQIQKYNTNTKIHKDKTVVCTLTPT